MKKNIAGAIVCGVLFALLIFAVKFVDVAAIGPQGTVIGLSNINGAVHEFFGVNLTMYNITDMLGLVAIAVACLFALAGLVQMIKRKSLLKVDKEIIALGFLYAVVVALYALFEIIIVNYRPIIMPDGTGPEASFPSSHTMLTIVVMGSAFMLASKYIKSDLPRILAKFVFFAIAVLTVAGRLVCGVHWFTDIAGGVLLSFMLLFIFRAVIIKVNQKPSYMFL